MSTADDRLVRTSVQLSSDQVTNLERIARGRQISMAAVIREAVREYLATLRRGEEALVA